MSFRRMLLSILLLTGVLIPAHADPLSPRLYQSLRWRTIGPFRGGRTVGAAGVPGKPNVFYIGVNNGGVWRSTDYGQTWQPLFDDQPTGSVGTVAVAPSNPDVLYVGSGEGLQRPDLSVGDGVYKSTDGGKTWKNMGLRDGQQIPAILVDPKDPNRVYVAVLGHPYGANAERGVFRSVDGGQSWEKILYKDENTGAIGLAFDPANSQTIYAALWASRQGPWENGAWQGPGSGLFKSTDGGTTWKQLTKGLPTPAQGLGRIGLDVARSDPNRLFAMVDAPQQGGVYLSEDAGESWRRVNSEQRIWGRGSDFAEVKIDPKDKDTIYVANTSLYRSTDGGENFTCIRGAPGGDDYHTVWINPENPDILLVASDQGAIVSANRGRTWSSWYNQPTAQFYHVITDNHFPYWVYGGQQESGSAGVASRGPYGQVTMREWYPVGVEEYGYVAPDPLNSNLIYGGKVTRFDRTTGQTQDVAPRPTGALRYRFLRTAPLVFSTVDPHVLFLGAQVLLKTTTGGDTWEVISPDLTREKPEVPESIGVFRTPDLASMPRRAVIYTVAPSYKDVQTIWCGTDDGLIHVTRDGGKSWQNVTPAGLTAWSKVSVMDAGRFDANTAYAAVNRIRCDDLAPHVYRTHDGGKTWTQIVRGLPDDPVNAVREDPVRKGLLYCGTERAVYVSFNDGDDWQPLRLNMPASSVRDLVVHDDDLVVGTHGRGFWILDDVTPLRQASAEVASTDAHLFKPQTAYRVRWNVNTDTPLPPEEPAGQNPPDGAVINYYLKEPARGPVTLEILDGAGKRVRRFASTDKPEVVDARQLVVAVEWARPHQPLAASAGMQRFVWDLHYPPPAGAGAGERSFPMTAVYHNTPAEPRGPRVLPGEYTVKLTANGKSYTQPLPVKMDPRVKTPAEGIKQQFTIALAAWEGTHQAREAARQIGALRARLRPVTEKADGSVTQAVQDFDRKLAALEGGGGRRGGRGGIGRHGGMVGPATLSTIGGQLGGVMALVEHADVAPTSQTRAAAAEAQKALADLLKRWESLRGAELDALNGKLRAANLPEVRLTTAAETGAAWPRFRGPDGAGIALGTGKLPVRFGPERNVRWKTALPPGISSPCIWGDRIFLTGHDKTVSRLETICLDRRDGKILWRQAAPTTNVEKFFPANSPATPTPTADGERVYVYLGSFGLLCYNHAGTEVWRKPLPVPETSFGTGTSPVLAGDRLLLVNLGRPPSLQAYAVSTGELLWKKERPRNGLGYAVPLVRRADDGVTEAIVVGGRGATAYDVRDGAERWWVSDLTGGGVPSPIESDGLLFIVAHYAGGDPDDRMKLPPFDELLAKYDKNKDGLVAQDEFPPKLVLYDRGSPIPDENITIEDMFPSADKNRDGKIDRKEWDDLIAAMARRESQFLAVRPGGKGDVTMDHVVWREKRALPECPTPVAQGGRLYMVKDGGLCSCFETKTGKLLYRHRLGASGFFYASPVTGDGKVYASSYRGVVVVFTADDKGEVLARNDLGEAIQATPAAVDGVLYVRTEGHLYAFAE